MLHSNPSHSVLFTFPSIPTVVENVLALTEILVIFSCGCQPLAYYRMILCDSECHSWRKAVRVHLRGCGLRNKTSVAALTSCLSISSCPRRERRPRKSQIMGLDGRGNLVHIQKKGGWAIAFQATRQEEMASYCGKHCFWCITAMYLSIREQWLSSVSGANISQPQSMRYELSPL